MVISHACLHAKLREGGREQVAQAGTFTQYQIRHGSLGLQFSPSCERRDYLPEGKEDNHFDHGKLQQRIEGCQELVSSQIE
jgi:hypothetical protein